MSSRLRPFLRLLPVTLFMTAAFAPGLASAQTSSLSVDDVFITEGDSGTTQAMVTVSISQPVPTATTFDVATANGTATAGSDYVAVNLTNVSIPAWASVARIWVTINGDTAIEASETLTVNISNAAGATIADGQGLLTIQADDADLSVSDVTVAEGDSGFKNITFDIILSQPSTKWVNFDYTTADGTAVAPTDYASQTSRQSISPGASKGTVTIAAKGDTVVEANETFFLNVSNVLGANMVDGQGVATITNDDAGAPTLSINNAVLTEGDSDTKTATFTVTLSSAQAGAVSFDIGTANQTATAGSDYVAKSTTGLQIAAGATSQTFSVTVNGDVLHEADETFAVDLSNPVGAGLADGQGIGTILNNDPVPLTLSVEDVWFGEGNSGTHNVPVMVRLSTAAAVDVSFDITTANGTATAPSDYVASTLVGQVIPAGQTSKMFFVTINGDIALEDDELFEVRLSNVVGSAVADDTATLIIGNDDQGGPMLSIGSASVTEGNSGTQSMNFPVTLSSASATPITVDYSTIDGTASNGTDYVGTFSGRLTIPAGGLGGTISVTVSGDTLGEGDETFSISLHTITGATLEGTDRAIGTIINDDPVPALSIANVSVGEGNVGSTSVLLTVSLSSPAQSVVKFDIATSNGTATGGVGAGADYIPLNLTNMSLQPGETSTSFNLGIHPDTTVEGDETVLIAVTNVNGATVADGNAVATIINDDGVSGPTISIADVTITEGDSGTKTMTFPVTLSQASANDVFFDAATVAGSAIAGSDFVAKSLTGQRIAAGATSTTFTVEIVGDTAQESQESFTVNLGNMVGATIADGQALARIDDNDLSNNAFITVNDVTISEGHSGTSTATFTVSLSATPNSTVTFDIATGNSSATAGEDYVALYLLGQTIAPGQTSKTFSVTINGDTTVESDETFVVNVQNVSGAGVTDGQGIGTIINDDSNGTPMISIDDASIVEGNGVPKQLVFTIRLAAPATTPVTYTIATSDSSADSVGLTQTPWDYTSQSMSQSIAIGNTTQTFSVSITGDTIPEGPEHFFVSLGNISGATAGDAVAVGTITNDDGVNPSLSIADAFISEGDSGTKTMNFTVSLSQAATGPVNFDIATANGTATADSDYLANSLAGQTISAGATSKNFAVTINGDTEVETNETFAVNLANVSGASLGDGSANGTITNDDEAVPGPWLNVADVTVTEGNSGTKTATFAVTLTSAASSTVSFDIATGTGSAEAGSDFVAMSLAGQTIAAGQTSKTFNVTVNGDTTVESDEYFRLNVTNVTGAILEDGEAFGNITNDDGAAMPEMRIHDQFVFEGTGGQRMVQFAVVLSAPGANTITYDIATADGTAVAGSDYTALNAPGETIAPFGVGRTFAVPITTDSTIEEDEVFYINISNVTGATLVDGQAFIAIGNDDVQSTPSLTIDDVSVVEGNSGTQTMTFTVNLSQAAPSTVNFDIATSNDSATSGSDYQALVLPGQSIAAGQSSKSFSVTTNGDAIFEADERFWFKASNVTGAIPIRDTASGTITNDDAASTPSLTIADVSISEGNSGTKTANFTVNLSTAGTSTVFFDIATANGSALAGSDFVASSLSGQTIAVGQTSKNFSVTINGDTTVETDEEFFVNVVNVSGAIAIDGSATGTITNDDVGNVAPAAGFSFTPAQLMVSFVDSSSDPDGSIASRHWDFGDGTASTALNPSKTYANADTYNVVLTVTDNAGTTASTSRAVRVAFPVALMTTDQYLWMVPPASSTQREGFLRLSNRQNSAATLSVWGLDAVGRRSAGTINLTLAANESRQFNSTDLERGNAAKGLTGNLGEGLGDWTIIVRSSADIEALAYIRTPDGFLTAMHDRVDGDGVDWFVPMFNPADNPNQVSHLRVINTNITAIDLILLGVDDAGATGLSEVVLSLPALTAVDLSSSDLENGNAAKGLTGRLGNGSGKWHLSMSSTGRISVQSLLADPLGKLTNLSTLPDLSETTPGEKVLWLVPPASNLEQQGFVRLINRENRASTVALWGIDDAGQRSPGTITMTLAARESKQLNSQDLESGNPAKGLTGSLGNGTGSWRLVALTDLDLIPLALIRTPDGFLTTVHETVAGNGLSLRVPIFNPAENPNQVSLLRIVNPNASTATVSLRGVDDLGAPGPGGVVTFSVAAGAAIELSATDLENGNVPKGLNGSLGNGAGKWALTMTSSVPLKVLNLLRDPRGYLTNLSTSAKGADAKLEP